MGLTQTRPEKNEAMTRAAHAARNALAKAAREEGLNIAEAMNASAHVMSALLVGAYSTARDREIVLSAMPDIVRAYFPQWEAIYRAHTPDKSRGAS